jgi:hypothetical protein
MTTQPTTFVAPDFLQETVLCPACVASQQMYLIFSELDAQCHHYLITIMLHQNKRQKSSASQAAPRQQLLALCLELEEFRSSVRDTVESHRKSDVLIDTSYYVFNDHNPKLVLISDQYIEEAKQSLKRIEAAFAKLESALRQAAGRVDIHNSSFRQIRSIYKNLKGRAAAFWEGDEMREYLLQRRRQADKILAIFQLPA